MNIARMDDEVGGGRRKGRPVGEDSPYERRRKAALRSLFAQARGQYGLIKEDLYELLGEESFSCLSPQDVELCLEQLLEMEGEMYWRGEWGFVFYLQDMIGQFSSLGDKWQGLAPWRRSIDRMSPLGRAMVLRAESAQEKALLEMIP